MTELIKYVALISTLTTFTITWLIRQYYAFLNFRTPTKTISLTFSIWLLFLFYCGVLFHTCKRSVRGKRRNKIFLFFRINTFIFIMLFGFIYPPLQRNNDGLPEKRKIEITLTKMIYTNPLHAR